MRTQETLGWGGLILLLLSGCATTLTGTSLARLPVPQEAAVQGVPFIEQSRHHCGPAALAMVLQWAGDSATQEIVSEMTFTPDKEGAFQMDLIGAARRKGFMAVPVRTYTGLLKEIAAGHPVIVFQNLGLSWFPRWHYAVVTAYDLKRSEITLHSGEGHATTLSLARFDRSWELADHWALSVLPPSVVSEAGDELDHLESASALERIGRVAESRAAYQSILKRWPQSLGAWVGMANTSYTLRDLPGAAEALEMAVRFHPEAAAPWHNLALVYGEMKKQEPAELAARKAMELVTPSQRVEFTANLAPVLSE